MSGAKSLSSEKNNVPEYTVTGIIKFLQSEWQRVEREKIQWDIEKAELRSRIAKLEEEKRRVIRTKSPQDLKNATSKESDDIDQHLVDARRKVAKTVDEIKALLEQSGMVPDDSPLPMQPLNERLLATLANFESHSAVAVIVIGQFIAAATGSGLLIFWDIARPNEILSKHKINSEDHDANVTFSTRRTTFLKFVESESLLVTAGEDGDVKAWPLTCKGLPTGEFRLIGSLDRVPTALDVGAGGLVAGAAGSSVKLWPLRSDLDDSEGDVSADVFPEFNFSCHVTSLAFSGAEIIIGLADARVLVASLSTGDILKRIAGASPDEALSECPPVAQALLVLEKPRQCVIIGMATGDIRIVALPRGEIISELPAAHRTAITSLSPSPKQDSFLSTGTDGTVALWTLIGDGTTWRGRLLSHDGGALCSYWNTDFIVVGGADAVTRVYNSP